MFIEIDELKSVIYNQNLSDIIQGDETIVIAAINSAVSEMKSYLKPSEQKQWRDGRPRYDVAKIFAATGDERDPLLLEFGKDIALYRVCRLSNVDLILETVQDRYDRAIKWLSMVAGVGKFKDSPTLTPDLPVLPDDPGTDEHEKLPFRAGGRRKFRHE